ncbi:MAG: hypothetical protein HRK26_00205 [Rickettsiaceae bacterium H1]|nr:hypothetical protein [Rickettsiaceae bacterium H1]
MTLQVLINNDQVIDIGDVYNPLYQDRKFLKNAYYTDIIDDIDGNRSFVLSLYNDRDDDKCLKFTKSLIQRYDDGVELKAACFRDNYCHNNLNYRSFCLTEAKKIFKSPYHMASVGGDRVVMAWAEPQNDSTNINTYTFFHDITQHGGGSHYNVDGKQNLFNVTGKIKSVHVAGDNNKRVYICTVDDRYNLNCRKGKIQVIEPDTYGKKKPQTVIYHHYDGVASASIDVTKRFEVIPGITPQIFASYSVSDLCENGLATTTEAAKTTTKAISSTAATNTTLPTTTSTKSTTTLRSTTKIRELTSSVKTSTVSSFWSTITPFTQSTAATKQLVTTAGKSSITARPTTINDKTEITRVTQPAFTTTTMEPKTSFATVKRTILSTAPSTTSTTGRRSTKTREFTSSVKTSTVSPFRSTTTPFTQSTAATKQLVTTAGKSSVTARPTTINDKTEITRVTQPAFTTTTMEPKTSFATVKKRTILSTTPSTTSTTDRRSTKTKELTVVHTETSTVSSTASSITMISTKKTETESVSTVWPFTSVSGQETTTDIITRRPLANTRLQSQSLGNGGIAGCVISAALFLFLLSCISYVCCRRRKNGIPIVEDSSFNNPVFGEVFGENDIVLLNSSYVNPASALDEVDGSPQFRELNTASSC